MQIFDKAFKFSVIDAEVYNFTIFFVFKRKKEGPSAFCELLDSWKIDKPQFVDKNENFGPHRYFLIPQIVF